MYRSNIYPKLILLVSFMVLGFGSAFAQLELKLQLMNDSCWGVYVKPVGITPSDDLITASGQVTIVMPNGFNWTGPTNVSGQWINNASNFGPIENPGRQYISFGLNQAEPLFPIDYTAGEETLLFMFCSTDPCPDSLWLIDCGTTSGVTDPFCPDFPDADYPSNSVGNNPGNDLQVLDFGAGFVPYNYTDNYAPAAWSCDDCDGDGILNGLEDTNGNGYFDAGDTTAMCDPCDPYHISSATLDFLSESDVICAGDVGDTTWFTVGIENITGYPWTDDSGWDPFTVIYTIDGGVTEDTVFNYNEGDSIFIIPSATTILDLITVIDSAGCEPPADSLIGGLTVSVEGPISVTDQPDDVTECSEDGNYFAITAANAGDGTISYNWQLSTDGGTTYANLDNILPYAQVFTDSMVIDEVAGMNGYQFRCAISTPLCDTVYSDWATLTVDGPISVTDDPDDITVCDDANAFFTAAGANAGVPGTMSYQWEVSTDGGTTWTPIAAGAVPGAPTATYSNVDAVTMNITAADVLMDGWMYRMEISTATCSAIYTAPATLDIEGPLTFTLDPVDFSNCAGGQVFFWYNFTNPGGGTVTYQWEESLDGGTTWAPLAEGDPYNGTNGTASVDGDTLSIADVIGLDGALYHVILSTSTCSGVTSANAMLDVSGNAEFTSISADDLLVCSGNDTIIVACATIPQGDFYWTWQYSTDDGVTWDSLEMGVGGADAALFSQSSGGALMSTGCDTLIIADVAGMYNYKFQAIAQATDCAGVISEEVQLRVEGPLSVNTDPIAVTDCAGNATTFTAVIDNPGYTPTSYRWQIDVGTGWVDLTNNAIYGGTNTDELIISDITGMDGYCFRLSAKSGTCNEIFTNQACLVVEGPIIYSQADDPLDVTLCVDDGFSFTSAATLGQSGTLSYQWQVSSDAGVNWTDIDGTTDGGIYSNWTTPTLSGTPATGLYDRWYRLAFTTGTCLESYSNMAALHVQGEITITDQPDDITECSGDPVFFIVDIADASPDFAGDESHILYLWQESTDAGATWNDLADGLITNGGSGVGGVNTDTLGVIETAGRDGNLFRALIWTDVCDTLYSDPATFFIEGPVSFIDDPDNVSECSGSGVTFTATTQNPGLGTIDYQWEISTDDGATYTNVANGGPEGYSGAGTNTLVITDVAGLYDERFRLKAWTQYCDTLWSNYAVLTVEGPISFTNQPDSVVVCSGNPACFEVETLNSSTSVNSSNITYQWQISVDAAATWNNLNNNSVFNGTKTANMCISDVAGLDSAEFRVLIQTANCASVASDPALLAVEGPISFTDHPDDVTQCSAEAIQFIGAAGIAVGNSGTISYQWQVSSDGVSFSDILAPGTPGYSGYDTDTLTITNVAGLNGYYYRLSAKTGTCIEVYSFDAMLTVEGPLAITLQPVDVQNCDDKEAFFFANVSNGALVGQQGLLFQWEVSTDAGATWGPVYDGTFGVNNYAGANTDSLLISPITGLNGYQYRMKSWTGTCDTLITNAAELAVEGPITFTDQPDDVTLCSGDPTCFTVAIDNSTGVGTVAYQWEVSANGVTWNDVSNGVNAFGGTYSGATTNQLCVDDIIGLYNYKYRCKVRTGTCDWEFSQLAQLFVEGPITIDQQPVDLTICDNVGVVVESEVSLPAASSGALNFQWQENDGSGWVNISNGDLTGGGFSMYSNDVGTETGDYFGTNTEDLDISLTVGMNGYQFRLIIWTSTCSDTTNTITLTVLDACSTGTCDFDLDGQINDTDTDDDNDLLADFWEDWMTTNNTIVAIDTFVGTGPWNYIDDLAVLINYSNCDQDTDNDGILDGLEDPDGDLLSNTEETDGDAIFDGNPLDPCDPILGPTCIGVSLAIDVQLQGPKIGTSGADPLMRDDLRVQDTLPRIEPYNDMSAFTHIGDGGTEYLTGSQAASVFSVTGDDAIVDWVFVELRSSTDLDSVITTRSAFIQRDGDVVDTDGVSDLTFINAPAGPYYVTVRHRNHLGVMSAEALDLSPITVEIDFTDPATPTYGDHAQIELNGEMYMWAGDVNSDGRTIYQGPGTDVFEIFFAVLSDPDNDNGLANFISRGYLQSDIDLDFDAVFQGPNNDRSLLLFNTTLSHPENTGNLANYVILETLP